MTGWLGLVTITAAGLLRYHAAWRPPGSTVETRKTEGPGGNAGGWSYPSCAAREL